MTILPAAREPGHTGPDQRVVQAAAEALAAGLVVGLPTETVYGLAVDPSAPGATHRLFRLKGRPRDVQLPVMVADEAQAAGLAAAVPPHAHRLMDRFWPGPLTIVLPLRPDAGMDLGSDHSTVGLRCPDHPAPAAVCRRAGPLATTSANAHGQPPISTAAGVAEAFGQGVALVIDGGTCEGLPSTVVDCTGPDPVLVREGRIAWADVAAAASPPPE